ALVLRWLSPVVGQSVVPVLQALVAGFFLAVELLAIPLQRRGLHLAGRLRFVGRHRGQTPGVGGTAFLLLLGRGAAAHAAATARAAPGRAAAVRVAAPGPDPRVRGHRLPAVPGPADERAGHARGGGRGDPAGPPAQRRPGRAARTRVSREARKMRRRPLTRLVRSKAGSSGPELATSPTTRQTPPSPCPGLRAAPRPPRSGSRTCTSLPFWMSCIPGIWPSTPIRLLSPVTRTFVRVYPTGGSGSSRCAAGGGPLG